MVPFQDVFLDFLWNCYFILVGYKFYSVMPSAKEHPFYILRSEVFPLERGINNDRGLYY